MKVQEAYEILGLSPKAELPEIKARYRRLMLHVHPDVSPFKDAAYPYTAQEINLAYAVLKEACRAKRPAVSSSKAASAPKKKTRPAWNAPINENAYGEREIFHYAEDLGGTIFGAFSIARGKYLWTPEEDFPLFLRSVYQCGKALLDEIDEALHRRRPPQDRQRIQAELTYLLAQQFTDGSAMLRTFAEERTTDSEGDQIFHMPAMLEPAVKPLRLTAGEILYPGKIRGHRLYLKNSAGRELGYLSFRDDRLYYAVVPLFEQRRVLVSIRAAEEQPAKSRKPSGRYKNLHLWLKLLPDGASGLPESLSLQISRLLEEYKRLPDDSPA